jgi:glycosyltransferase involved in cell wall biosynthesis
VKKLLKSKTNALNFEDPNKPLIGLNGRFLIAQRTGVQRCAYRLLETIIEQGTQYNFVLFTGDSEVHAPEWKLPHVRVVASHLVHKHIFRNYLWEQFTLPRLAKKYEVDLLHNPANLAPLFFNGKSIVNIYDICFMIQPSWFSLGFRIIYNTLIPKIARNSSLVLTCSNYSKNDILQNLNVSVDKVRVNYCAVDEVFFKHRIPYDERPNRLLFVGSLEPRKNLRGLLEAFKLYKRKYPESDLELSVVGCKNNLFAEESYDFEEFQNSIRFEGYLTDEQLSVLYGSSKALIFPSFYEGFGFPPVEAMAAGTPVIASNTSSLPEIVGKAAILVNPNSIEEICLSIERVLETSVAKSLVSLGLERVKEFSWADAGKHTLEIYSELFET